MGMVRAVLGAAAGVAVLAGCTSAAQVEPGPHASDPMCAEVLRSAPEVLAGLPERSTTSQSTQAWGDPPIVMRCGVEVLGPTTEHCITVSDAEGTTVDWVLREPETSGKEDVLTLTTYGRVPAVEVRVPLGWGEEDHDAILSSLGAAVAQIPQTRECISIEDAL